MGIRKWNFVGCEECHAWPGFEPENLGERLKHYYFAKEIGVFILVNTGIFSNEEILKMNKKKKSYRRTSKKSDWWIIFYDIQFQLI